MKNYSNLLVISLICLLANTIEAIDLVPITCTATNRSVNAVTWLKIDNNFYLAVGGSNGGTEKEIQIYLFDPLRKELIPTGAVATFSNGSVQTLQWLHNGSSYYLAAGGSDANSISQEIRVYQFNPEQQSLSLQASAGFNNGIVNSVNWLTISTKQYLAVGGDDNGLHKEIRVYEFNPIQKTLKVTNAIASFSGEPVHTVQWLDRGNQYYLAVGGADAHSISQEIRVYQFHPKTERLILQATASFNNGIVNSVNWLTSANKYYLAVGGDDNGLHKEVRVYIFNPIKKELKATNAVASFSAEPVQAVQWVERGSQHYLVAAGADGNSIPQEIRVYQFNPVAQQLIVQATGSFNNGIVNTISWLNTVPTASYLAAGGENCAGTNQVKIYELLKIQGCDTNYIC